MWPATPICCSCSAGYPPTTPPPPTLGSSPCPCADGPTAYVVICHTTPPSIWAVPSNATTSPTGLATTSAPTHAPSMNTGVNTSTHGPEATTESTSRTSMQWYPERLPPPPTMSTAGSLAPSTTYASDG